MQAHDRNQVLECVLELQQVLADLATRHTPLIVIASLLEHVRGAMVLSREARACTPQTAKEVARRVREIAFAP